MKKIKQLKEYAEDLQVEDIIWSEEHDGWRMISNITIDLNGKYHLQFDNGQKIISTPRKKHLLM